MVLWWLVIIKMKIILLIASTLLSAVSSFTCN